MTAFLLLARTEPHAPADPRDADGLMRGAAAMGLPPPTTRGADSVVGTPPTSLLDPTRRVTRSLDAPPIHVVQRSGRVLVGSSIRGLLATGLVARRLDPSGVAGWLWRGAPVANRPPVADVRSVPAGAALACGTDGAWRLETDPCEGVLSTPAEVRLRLLEAGPSRNVPVVVSSAGGLGGLALAHVFAERRTPAPEVVTVRFPTDSDARLAGVGRLVSARGARHHVVSLVRSDPMAALSAYLTACDVPTPDGFSAALVADALAAAGVADAIDGAGASILFGAGPAFAAVAREPRPRGLRRAPPSADELDVDAQRAVEIHAFARVPVNLALSAAARLPAGTREALSRCGPRPVDGFLPPRGSRLEVAAETWLRGPFADRVLGAARGARPAFLESRVLAAVRGLPPPVRFGRPGSGGLLARLAGRGAGTAGMHGAGFEGTLSLWARGPLRPWLDATLSPERVASTRALEPAAVTQALARFHAGTSGWTATRILTLAFLVAWIERERLVLPTEAAVP